MDATTAGFIIYLLAILFVGLYTSRVTRGISDFAIGSRRLGPWVIAFSERASGESAWLILGLPGAALMLGMVELWTVIGCLSGIIFSWLLIAKKLREESGRHHAITLPELLSKMHTDRTQAIRLMSSMIITFFFTFYVAAQFIGAGKVLDQTFGIDPLTGMMLGALIIIFYTMLGGFFAVAWTDLFQGVIMIGTLVILPVVGFIELSGYSYQGSVVDLSNLYGGETGFAAFSLALGGLSWGLGYMGQPHLVTRYMAINDAKNIALSRKIAISWAVPAFFGALFIGLIGSKLIAVGAIEMPADSERLMPLMATTLLPSWIAGIFISGAIAAMMSTADSQLLVATSVLSKDLYQSFIKRDASNSELLVVSRTLTLVIGGIAFAMAYSSDELVFELVGYAWSGLGSSFGPALLLSLWWSRTSQTGVLMGMATGTLFTIYDISSGLITVRVTSFLLAFLAAVVGSILFPPRR